MHEILRKWAYPDDEYRKETSGAQYRFSSTEEFIEMASQAMNQPLDWFFETYLYFADLPELHASVTADTLKLKWQTRSEKPFTLPVPVVLDGECVIVNMQNMENELPLNGRKYQIDPNGLILKELVFSD